MQETSRQNSIVSYAGTSKTALLTIAKQAFAQADFDVPSRFATFVPLFPFELIQNMDYVEKPEGNKALVAPSGFSIDPREYHFKLYMQMPDLYEGDNHQRNFDYEGHFLGRSVFTVDQAWATRFPQYSPFMGEKLVIHLIGGGHQAVAVPESVFPRGRGVLSETERAMRITERAQQFLQYARGRLAAGEPYQAEAFGADFLSLTGLEPVMLRQSELGRVMQDLSIARSLQTDAPTASLFTENAKRVENLRQYVPYHYACDTFEAEAITRHTARLFQPCMQGNEYVSDLWIPYQDLSGYLDKQNMAVDMARLCEGYQIAPVYDPATGGARYPDAIRVVQVRDREIKTMVGDVLNNPAYGGGMNPLGMIGRQVFIESSQEMLRQRKLTLEPVELVVTNTTLSAGDYQRRLMLCALQEIKGKLIDAMYSREAALAQMSTDASSYEKVKAKLDEKVEAVQARVDRESAVWKHGQVSGYDADIDYLRRKQWDREGIPEDDSREPIVFSIDPQREQSIESGYAMRSSIQRISYEDAYVPPALEKPEPEADHTMATEDAKKPPDASPVAEEDGHADASGPENASSKAKGSKALKSTINQLPVTDAADGDAAGAARATEVEDASETGNEEKTDSVDAEEPGDASDAAGESVESPDSPPDDQQGEDSGSPGVPKSPGNAPADPVSLEDVAKKAKVADAPVVPKLAYIVRRESESPIPVNPVNKGGKMASLMKKKTPEDEEE